MRIGNMRREVTLQRIGTSKNALGEIVQTWTTLVTRRAAIRPLMGREYWQASGEHSDVNAEIRMRYDSALVSLKPRDRAIDTSVSPQVIYDIQSVVNVHERHHELVMMCVRRNG